MRALGVPAALLIAPASCEVDEEPVPHSGLQPGHPDAMPVTVLEQPGLVEVAGWPATPGVDYGAKLLDLLEERIEEAADEDERTRLQGFREALRSVGTNVVSGVLTDLVRRGM